MPDVSVLTVLLYGRPIGTLTRVAGDRILFSFNEAYIADDARPVLSLGFKDALGGLIADFRPTQTRLMPFFSNLLPEGPLRAYLAGRAQVNPGREFFLLWALGADLPGAVTVEPSDGEAWPPAPDDDGEEAEGRREDRRRDALRFSLAGVQLKFSAVEAAARGLTIPAKGVGGSWIVKLPSPQWAGVPENEFAMMSLARRVGIDVPAVRLLDIAAIGNLPEGADRIKGNALAVRRFDRRDDGTAVHIEDFAQVFRVYPEDKYKKAGYRNIASVIAAESGEAGVAEFIRRLTFAALIGNADLHLKNVSMIYPDRRRAALAPAYDLVSTVAYLADANAALKFSRTRRFDEFTEDELAHLAAKARVPTRLVLDAARQTVALFHQHWRAEKQNLPLTGEAIRAIEGHMGRVPIG